MKRTTLFLMFVFLSFLGLQTIAQTTIAKWDFEDAGNRTAPVGVDANVTASDITVTAGSIEPQPSIDDGGTSIVWVASWNQNDFSTSAKYFEYTIQANAGYSIALDEFKFRFGRTNAGPAKVTVQYSLDGFATEGVTILDNADVNSTNKDALDFFSVTTGFTSDDLTELVTVRVWGHNASGTGNFRINNFEVVAEVKALNHEALITDFELAGVSGIITDAPDWKVELTFPFGTDVTALTPVITVSDGATISPAVGVTDFTETVSYTIIAENGINQNTYDVFVTVLLNDEAEITTFEVFNQTAAAVINSGAATIEVEVLYGTDITELIPTIEISENAEISPAIGVEVDFTGSDITPFEYTVTAEDGTVKVWAVTLTVAATESTENDITAFEIADMVSVDIDATAHTVEIGMPYGYDLTALTPVIEVSLGATISPASGVARDFSNSEITAVEYSVFAQNNDEQVWQVAVFYMPNTAAEIESFEIADQIGVTMIDEDAATVYVVMPGGTDVTALVPAITISENATISPADGVAQDFTNAVLYTVTAEDGVTTKEWTVTVHAQSSEAFITAFELAGVMGAISEDNITVSLPFGTEVTALTPVITISEGASISEVVGETDFTNPVNYTVIAEDGVSTNVYTITVTVLPNDKADILSFVLAEQLTPAVIDVDAATVVIDVLFGTDVTALIPAITISENAEISPAMGVAVDFTNDVEYTVTAENSTEKVWTVTVNVAASANTANDIITFEIADMVSVNIDAVEKEVDVVMPFGTDLSSLIPSIEVSPGASISPNSGVAQNFESEFTYMVTAQDPTAVATWYVNVTHAPNTEANIEEFILATVEGVISEEEPYTVVVTLPYGTDVTALVPAITISENATISPADGVAQDFTNAVVYTVTAEDGITEKAYTVSVEFDAPSTEANIVDFIVAGQVGDAVISTESPWTVDAYVAAGTDVTALTPVITLSEGATISPVVGETDFTDAVAYVVTAQDETTEKTWTVTLHMLEGEADIIDFVVAGQIGDAVISTESPWTVAVNVNGATDVTALTPVITLSEGATISPVVGETDFTNAVEYIVTSEDGLTMKTWTVTVSQLSNEAEILTFAIDAVEGVIESADATVTVVMPNGTDLSNLTPAITISAGAQISPVWSDFTEARVYTVTAEDGTTKDWTVTVTEAPVDTYVVTFSVVGTPANGTLIAEVETVEITSGDEVEEGATVIFTAAPATGYVVKEWTIDGTVVADFTDLVLSIENLADNVEVTVEFDVDTRINTSELSSVSIYPNPNNGQFVIDFANIDGKVNYEIYDAKGTIILSNEFVNYGINTAEVSLDVPAGVYFIRMIKDETTVVERIVVQ